jgi:hypothetical protein
MTALSILIAVRTTDITAKVKFTLSSVKHHVTMRRGRVEAQLHAYLTSSL